MSLRLPINQGWVFNQIGGGKGTKKDEWLATKSFPTSVHVELMKYGRISDPFVGLVEHEVQWVGEAEWAFKTEFQVPETSLASKHADLTFEGLDTYATVSLNGHKILESNNQHVPYTVDVKQYLKSGSNELLIVFHSTFVKGRELEEKHGKLKLWNGDSSRLHVRKAQYNYGWDWGPVLMTVGPWRPIYLRTYNSKITDLRVSTNVDEDLIPHIEVQLAATSANGEFEVSIMSASGTIIKSGSTNLSNGEGKLIFDSAKGDFDLWWPVGYGKQPLYKVVAQLKDEGSPADSTTAVIGFRRVRIIQDPLLDQDGRSFLFEINNVRIFCGGSNWIPADSFLTVVTDEVYRAWLKLMVDGNQNMVRIWGGGIYEADAFYDICDELGLLVWQDYMFGCGQYPAYDEFLDRLVPEVEANVKRLRHHPSVVIWAGNNEDYALAESFSLELDYSDEDPKSDFRRTNFPARHIYERVLPSITERLSDIYYHRSSPYSGFGKPTTDQQHGDIHQWNVWHGSQEPWHNWDKLAGRFVSEFGMQGYPNIRTVDYWLGGDAGQRYPQSQIMNSHNKADGFERRIEVYLVENFKHAFDIESYVYYTQIMQSETLATAYRLWRRNWKGLGREYTAGALVWQINDCWPVTSWAIVDYFLRPKPAYFSIARELKAYTVGITRKDVQTFANKYTAADYAISTEMEIWGTNSSLVEKKAELEVTSFNLQSGWRETFTKEATLPPNQATELFQGPVPGQPVRTSTAEIKKDIVVSARLLDANGSVLARFSNWPEPYKFISFPSVEAAGLNITVGADGESVTLSSKKPIKGIVLDVDGEDVKWGDQAIDLIPDDAQIVSAIGLNGRTVKARYLGDGRA